MTIEFEIRNLSGVNKSARERFGRQNLAGGVAKQQPEGTRTEDPSTHESHHENGRGFPLLKQASLTRSEELVRTGPTQIRE